MSSKVSGMNTLLSVYRIITLNFGFQLINQQITHSTINDNGPGMALPNAQIQALKTLDQRQRRRNSPTQMYRDPLLC